MSKKVKIIIGGLLAIAFIVAVCLVARQSMKLDEPQKATPVKVEKRKHKTVYKKESNEVTVTVDTEEQ